MAPSLFVFTAFFFLFMMSVVFHELGHALMALWCGDSTARDHGRITLNPIAHIDPIWTLLMPLVCLVFLGFPFGGAKPVPVMPSNFRKPRRDDRLVSLAGPMANVIQAILYALLFHVLFGGMTAGEMQENGLAPVLLGLVYINILLAVFNLLPIPPLDGSHVLASFLPDKIANAYRRIGVFGIMILLILLSRGPFLGYLFMVISGGFTLLGLNFTDVEPIILKLFNTPNQLGL